MSIYNPCFSRWQYHVAPQVKIIASDGCGTGKTTVRPQIVCFGRWFGTFETQIIDRSSSFTQAAIGNLTLLAKRPSKPSKGPTDSKGLLATFLRDVSHCFTMFGNACPSVFIENMPIGEAYNFQQQLHLSTSCLAYNPAGTTAAKAARTL